MADLPQVNTPNIGMGQIPYQGNLATGLAQGANTATQNYIGLQQLGVARQQLAFQQQQAKIQNGLKALDALLPQMTNYPQLAKYYWPTVASTLNSLSPDYGLDPKSPPPPEVMQPFTKGLFQVMSGLQEGSISMPQAHMMTKGLISDHMPTPAPMTPEQSVNAGMEMISQAPLSQQKDMMEFMSKTPQYQTMESNLEQNRQAAQTEQSHQLQLKQDMMNQFTTQSKDFQQVGSNYNVLTGLLSTAKPSSQAANKDEELALAAQEKTAMAPLIQMLYAGSARPGSPDFMEKIEETGDWSTLGQQALKRVFIDGQALTGSQLKAVRTDAFKIFKAREQTQSQYEDTFARAAQANRIEPQQIFAINPRPANAVSTSKYFQTKSSDQSPLIGHVTNFKGGTLKGPHVFLGGDPKNPVNWANAEGNE